MVVQQAEAVVDNPAVDAMAAGKKLNQRAYVMRVAYSATDAKSHLLVKLRYLEDRGMVDSAEQFIELAASKSSMSGQPYQVRCANAAPVPSSTWLLSQLQRIRATPGAKGAP